MTRMKPTRPFVVSLLVLVVLVAPAVVGARDEAIDPDSPQGENVRNAIEMIRDAGYEDAADEIEADLEAGNLYASDELDSDTNAETGATGNVTINTSVVGNFRGSAYNPDGATFRLVAELARTLFHENIHANHQGFGDTWWGNMPGETTHETEAWRDSILMVSKMLNRALKRYRDLLRSGASRDELCRALDRYVSMTGLLADTLKDYKHNDCYGSDYDLGRIDDQISQADAWRRDAQRRYEELCGDEDEDEPPPPPTSTPTPTDTPTPTPTATPTPSAEETLERPCPPCQPLADQVKAKRDELRELLGDLQETRDQLRQTRHDMLDQENRIGALEVLLAQSAGTGGECYDPSTRTTTKAYDQGDGTVKIEVWRDGRKISERTRDANDRKARLRARLDAERQRLEELRAQEARLQEQASSLHDDARTAVDELLTLVEALEECVRTRCGYFVIIGVTALDPEGDIFNPDNTDTLFGGDLPEITPTPPPTPTPTPTAGPDTPTPAPTETGTPPPPTPTPEETPTPTPTEGPADTATPTPTPTDTPLPPTPTDTPLPATPTPVVGCGVDGNYSGSNGCGIGTTTAQPLGTNQVGMSLPGNPSDVIFDCDQSSGSATGVVIYGAPNHDCNYTVTVTISGVVTEFEMQCNQVNTPNQCSESFQRTGP